MNKRWRQSLSVVGVAVALGAVMSMYLQPEFMLTVAQQVWACF